MPQSDPASEFLPAVHDGASPNPVNDLPAVGDFTRLALWMAGALAGITTQAHAAQRRHFRSMAKRLGWPVGKALAEPRPGMASAMPLLTDAIIGTSRAAIASVFGPPCCALTDDEFVTNDAIWSGEVWYYGISNPAASAIAIAFSVDETASRLLFISYTPQAVP